MNEDITILLALEARDKASAIIKQVSKTFGDFGTSIKAAAAQASRSGADIEAANTRAAAASASYKRAAAAQVDAQAALSAAMGRSEAAIQAEAAAQVRGTEATARAAAVAADAARAEEVAYTKLGEAQKLVAARSEEAAAAQKAASAETGIGTAALKGAAVAGAALAVGVVAVGALSVKAAADFQTGAVKLETTAGETHQNIGLVSDGMLKLAGNIGTTTENIEGGMYRVESAGFHGANGLNVLRVAGEAARAEGARMDTVTRALTSALNAYGDTTGKTAVPMTNEIIAAVGRGDMTMEQFAGSLSAVLPIAAAAGISFAQIGGAIATMTAQGMTADQASQNLAHTIGKLQSPTIAQTKYMQQLGIDTQDLSAKLGERGLTGTIRIISDAIIAHMGPGGKVVVDALNKSKVAAADAQKMLASMPPGLQKVAEEFLNGSISVGQWRAAVKDLPANQAGLATQFAALVGQADGFNQMLKSGQPDALNYAAALKQATGDQTAMNTILKLSGDHAAVFTDNVNAVGAAGKNAGTNIAGWDKIQGTFNFKMDQLKGNLEAAKIALGTGLLPIVSAMVGWIAKALGPLTEWVTKHKQLAAGALALVGGLGATVVMLAGVAKAMQLFKVAGEGARIMMVGLRLATIGEDEALMANPIGIVIGLLALLAVGIYEAWQHSKTFRDIVIAAWGGIKDAALAAWNGVLKPVFEALKAAISAIGKALAPVVTSIVAKWREMTTAITNEWGVVSAKFAGIASLLQQIWARIGGFVMAYVHMIVDVMGADWDIAFGAVKITWNLIWGVIRGAWELIVGIVKADLAVIVGVLKIGWAIVVGTVRVAWDTIKFVINTALDLIRGILRIFLDIVRGNWSKAWSDILNLVRTINNDIFSFLRNIWNDVLSTLSSIVHTLWSTLVNVWHSISSGVIGAAHSMWDGLKGAFNAGVDALAAAWNRLKDAAMVPVRFVVQHVINPLIGGYNSIAGAFGVHQVSKIGGFAAGGSVFGPGGEKADMIPALLSHNEHVWTADEVRAAGGHRAVERIRAMVLGRGLPTYPGDGSAGIPKFAGGGGVLGSIGGFFSDIWSAITNPGAVVAKLVGGALGAIPGGGGVRDLLVGMAHKLMSGLTSFITGGGGGSGNAGAARAFLLAQNGKPYVWASAGPGGYDCSGIVSAVWNVLHGRSPYSHTFSTMNEAPFFPIPGLGGVLSAGWTNPGESGPGGNSVGHTAGVLAGIPFESTGSRGVHMGAGVTPIGRFAHIGHFDQGGPLHPGLTLAYNGTGKTEWVQNPNGSQAPVVININEPHIMSDRDIDWLLDRIDKRLVRVMVPGAGVQVRR